MMIKTLKAKAHCDIPCSIYEPTPAKIAAKTVQRMIEQIAELQPPKDMSDKKALLYYLNYVSRRMAVKETHAETCKRELSILWTDFFKYEHLKKFPGLHDIFWKAMKLCSKNKQEVNIETAKELVKAVDEIAKIFYEAKGDKERYGAYQKITDKLY